MEVYLPSQLEDTKTFYVNIDIVNGGGRAPPPPPPSPGCADFPSWWNVHQKVAIATLCLLLKAFQRLAEIFIESSAKSPLRVPGRDYTGPALRKASALSMSYATPNQWAAPHPTNELLHTQPMSYSIRYQWTTPHAFKQWATPYATNELRHIQKRSYSPSTPNQWATAHTERVQNSSEGCRVAQKGASLVRRVQGSSKGCTAAQKGTA